MAQDQSKRAKAEALLEEGTLNASAEQVRDPKFQEGEFFDPRDAVQVKYEMLRRVRVENTSVTDATGEYGVSRPTYYQAQARFTEAGIAGLVPKKRGPSRASQNRRGGVGVSQAAGGCRPTHQGARASHAGSRGFRAEGASKDNRTGAGSKKNFSVNSETLENRPAPASTDSTSLASRYESLRRAALGDPVPPESRSGLVVLLRRGLWGWARVLPTLPPPQASHSSVSSSPTAPHSRRAAIELLATMAESNPTRRAHHERIPQSPS